MPDAQPAPYLESGRFVDSDHPSVIALARERTEGMSDPRERAVALYYGVRDDYRNDPYWTPTWLWGLGLHRLMGTIRYPGTA